MAKKPDKTKALEEDLTTIVEKPVMPLETEVSVDSDESQPTLSKGVFVGRPDTKSMGKRTGVLVGGKTSEGVWETREELFERTNKDYNLDEIEHEYIDSTEESGGRFKSVRDKAKRNRPGPAARRRRRKEAESATAEDTQLVVMDEPSIEDVEEAEVINDMVDEKEATEAPAPKEETETPTEPEMATEDVEEEHPKVKKARNKATKDKDPKSEA